MTVVDDSLRDCDINVVGRLHVETLPESLVSIMGERYARSFYRYVSSSPDEIVFLERGGPQGDHVVGACIVSLHPETLSRRLLRRTPLVPMALLALARLVPKLRLGKSQSASKTPTPVQPPGPEIMLIFTLPSVRSLGYGARLLARSESWLAARGVRKLYVKTRDASDNRAIGFYERAGYQRLASIEKRGKRLVLFDKSLSTGFALPGTTRGCAESEAGK